MKTFLRVLCWIPTSIAVGSMYIVGVPFISCVGVIRYAIEGKGVDPIDEVTNLIFG